MSEEMPTLVALSDDELACVCQWLDVIGIDSVACTCKTTHAAFKEPVYKMIATLQWGADFWRIALTRNTKKVFSGMRRELVHLHILYMHCELHSVPMWTIKDFLAFWKYEEQCSALRS